MCEDQLKIFQKVLLTSSLFALSSASFAETSQTLIKDKKENADSKFEKPVLLAETPVSYQDFDTLKITVTGTRTERAIKDVPAAISTFDYDQINEIAPLSWRDVFKYDASISSQDFSRSDGSRTYATGDKGNINIRGVEGNRILTLIDGIPIPRFSYGRQGTYAASRLNYIDFSNIGNIEVLKGPGSSLYGSSAMGGVVSIRSLIPDDILEEGKNSTFEISSPYNSQNSSYQPSIKYAFKDEDFSGVFAYSYGNYSELNRNTDSKYINDVDGDLDSYYVKLIKSTSNTDFDLTFENINKDTTTIGSSYYNTETGLNAQKDFRDSKRTRISFGINYEADQDQLIDKFSGKIYSNSMENKSDYFVDAPQSIGRGGTVVPAKTENTKVELNQEMVGANFQVTNNFNTKWSDQKLTAGVDVNFNDASRIRNEFENGTFDKAYKSNPDSDILKLGFYVQDEIRFNNWDIIAGIRYDANNIDAYDSDEWYDSLSIVGLGTIDKESALGKPISKDFSNWSPSISANYKLNDDVTFYGKYARSFRAPSWEDLNSSRISLSPGFSYTTIGNPDLKEETSDNFEIGVKGRTTKSDFGLATFLNKYDNFIDKSVNKGFNDTIPYTYQPFGPPGTPQQTVNAAKYQSVNIPETTIWGIEADYKYYFSERNKGLSVSTSASLVKGRDDTNDQNLDSVNPFTAITSLNYIFPKNNLSASLITTYVAEPNTSQDYLNPGQRFANNVYVPDSFITTDFVLKYKPSERFIADLGVYNLFDATYYLWSDIRANGITGNDDVAYQRYAQPGTSIKAGFKWRF